jgi:hypothetical protein
MRRFLKGVLLVGFIAGSSLTLTGCGNDCTGDYSKLCGSEACDKARGCCDKATSEADKATCKAQNDAAAGLPTGSPQSAVDVFCNAAKVGLGAACP